MSDTLKRIPFDPERIAKGTRFTVAELEKMTRTKFGTTEYQFRLLNLGEAIEKYTLAAGDPVVTKTESGELLILTDAEASVYANELAEMRVRQVKHSFKQMLHVNPANLDIEENQAHQRNVLNKSRLIQAMVKAGAPIRMVKYQRSLPGLPIADTKESP